MPKRSTDKDDAFAFAGVTFRKDITLNCTVVDQVDDSFDLKRVDQTQVVVGDVLTGLFTTIKLTFKSIQELHKLLVMNFHNLRMVIESRQCVVNANIFLEELTDMSGEEAAIKLLKLGSIFNFKDCIMRTDPGTNFTGKETVDLLASMGVEWKVGVADDHVSQGHLERAFRELNYNLRPILASFAEKATTPVTKMRMAIYLSARIYNHSVNQMGFAPAEMFTPSETLNLQVVEEGHRPKTELVKEILGMQSEVLQDMLIAQQKLYDDRLDDWRDSGKKAWDDLLYLEIDDLVLINYPKNSKLNYSNIGPYKIVKMIDENYFVIVQSLIDSNIKIKVRANRLIRFNYDERCGRTPVQIQAQDKRQVVIDEVFDWDYPPGKRLFTGAAGERQQLMFKVRYVSGGEAEVGWDDVKYLEKLDEYLATLPTVGPNSMSRKGLQALRSRDKKRKPSGVVFTLAWKENFDNAYMVKQDGVLLTTEDEYNLSKVTIGGTADERAQVRTLIHKYSQLFQPKKPDAFVNYPVVKYQMKDEDPSKPFFGSKWIHPRPIHDPRALAACDKILQET